MQSEVYDLLISTVPSWYVCDIKCDTLVKNKQTGKTRLLAMGMKSNAALQRVNCILKSSTFASIAADIAKAPLEDNMKQFSVVLLKRNKLSFRCKTQNNAQSTFGHHRSHMSVGYDQECIFFSQFETFIHLKRSNYPVIHSKAKNVTI